MLAGASPCYVCTVAPSRTKSGDLLSISVFLEGEDTLLLPIHILLHQGLEV